MTDAPRAAVGVLALSDDLLFEILRAICADALGDADSLRPLAAVRLVSRRFRDVVDGAGGPLALAPRLRVTSGSMHMARAVADRAASLTALRELWWSAVPPAGPVLSQLPRPSELRSLVLVAWPFVKGSAASLATAAARLTGLERLEVHVASRRMLPPEERALYPGDDADDDPSPEASALCGLVGRVLESNPRLSDLVVDCLRVESFRALLGAPERRAVPLRLCLGACRSEGAGRLPRLSLASLYPDACPAAARLASLHVKNCELAAPPSALAALAALPALRHLTLGDSLWSDPVESPLPPLPPSALPQLRSLAVCCGDSEGEPSSSGPDRLAAALVSHAGPRLESLLAPLPAGPEARAALRAFAGRRLALACPALFGTGAASLTALGPLPSVSELALVGVADEGRPEAAAARSLLRPGAALVLGDAVPEWARGACACGDLRPPL